MQNDNSILKPIKKIVFTSCVSLFIILISVSLMVLNNHGKNPDVRIEIVLIAFIILCSILILVAINKLYEYIKKPLNELYKGIHSIGLTPINQETTTLDIEVKELFQNMDNLISLIESMNNNSSFTETLGYINNTFSSFIPYNYIGVALVDSEKQMIKASYGVSDGNITELPEKLVGLSIPLKDTSLEKLLHTGDARIINDLESYVANKPLKIYNQIILNAGIRASITLPLKVSGEPVGMIFFSSCNKNVYNTGHINFLKTLVNSIAISFNQNIFINDLLYSDIIALAKLAEARDEDTGEHLERMKRYSRVIVELLYENNIYHDEVTTEFIDDIERFSPLHDIGKVGISDKILLKPAKLTVEEFDEMKRHASYGAEVLKAAEENIGKRGRSIFQTGIEISESHHEKWDGSGYPFGKSGLEIPLSARIVAVADVFDALTSKRPYKKAFTFEESLDIISTGRGKHFDPQIVDVFLANQNRIKGIYLKFNPPAGH